MNNMYNVFIYKIPNTKHYEYQKEFKTFDLAKKFILDLNNENYSFFLNHNSKALGGGKLPLTEKQFNILVKER